MFAYGYSDALPKCRLSARYLPGRSGRIAARIGSERLFPCDRHLEHRLYAALLGDLDVATDRAIRTLSRSFFFKATTASYLV